MPFPQEHSCRLRSPDEFQPKSFRRMERPKGVSLIIARPKGKITTATQAIRYDKDVWTAERASADCEEKGGSFEAAASESKQDNYQEASWQDMLSLDNLAKEFGDVEEAMDGKLQDAATIKAQIQNFLRQADALLGTKNLPDSVVASVKSMRIALHKTWEELTKGEDDTAAEEESKDIEIDGDFIALVEAVAGSETVPIKIIQPGWGSSGFYSANVLEQAAPVYKKGTQMYWDHPTLSEEKERPERTIRDLAGVLTSDGRWNSSGSAGPGIYADAKVFGPYKDAVRELAPHIGVSHRAFGKAKKGEAEGQKGNIIEQITAAQSVDFVTSPGAGGKVLQLFEAARGQVAPIRIEEKEEQDMTDEEKVALENKVKAVEAERDSLKEENEGLKAERDALKTEKARLSERMLGIDAVALVTTELKDAQIPDLTRQRLIETLGVNPPVKDGKLDEEAFKETIKSTLASEVEYLGKVTGSGRILGMGTKREKIGSMMEAFKTQYLREGKSEEEAEKLATIAAEGR